mgnify:CR=1 FL=1
MNPAQPFFGLQALGVDGFSQPHGSIDEMARAYLAEIRDAIPDGPYLFGGYSAGGIVAYEMARILTLAGERVALLALIDTMHPRAPVRRTGVGVRLDRLRREGMAYVIEAWERRRRDWTIREDLRKVERHIARGETIPFALRNAHLVRNFRRIAGAYEPKPWPGRATLFRAETIGYLYRDAGPTYGWDREVLGGVEVVAMPGDHHTLLLGKNAEPLARALDAAIERATPSLS